MAARTGVEEKAFGDARRKRERWQRVEKRFIFQQAADRHGAEFSHAKRSSTNESLFDS